MEFCIKGGGATTASLDVAFWDGANWNGIAGTGANGNVAALAFARSGLLYIGGALTEINGVTVNGLATWDGSVWDDINGGADSGVAAIAISLNGLVYFGGSFTTIGGVSANRIAYWNGSTFFPLGDGVNSVVTSIAIGLDGTIYLGGIFTVAGDVELADRVARWNGYTFAHLDIDLPGSPQVDALLASKFVDPVVPDIYDVYLGYTPDGDETGAYAGLIIASNVGTIPAFPKIIFSRSGGDEAIIQTLRNERTGRELLFDYSLLDGESLTIDLNPKNRTITSSFFGPRMDATLANSDLSTWQLLPGNNSVTSFVSEDGSPTITAWLLYRTPYKSWN